MIFFIIGLFIILSFFQIKYLFHSNFQPQISLSCQEGELAIYLKKLKERVKTDLKDRVPEEFIETLFCSSKLTYLPEIMNKSLTWRETALPYHQFLEESRLKRAKEFIEQNRELLKKIENFFDVEKETLVAIFLVETDLGKNTGNYNVFNVFLSLALSGERELYEKFINPPHLSLEDELIKKRWERRSNWGYRELLYLIEIAYKNHWDPFSLKGSIFGAFGYPQFVPRSYVIYGYDWNGDGKIDLYEIQDALASIANYLQKEGYKRELSYEGKKKIIMKYNISEPYAKTILAIVDKLKNESY
ncbi:MAG: lytic murein transglycosylase [Thermodesulfobacteriaceae bacterium]|nr:lytic murein transglycosylase [Thermodesulfobacteriaceae bacterium]MCX8041104.1 lytic murein transglycosylase [Thermodesulfobacteriaceae bacterium]MDW8135545.1 lytic murein transglycosylase [Thermodesulfobacterium sp.]